MSKTDPSKSPSNPNSGEAGRLEKRLDEIEIKMAFLEKELEEYKEASRGFYGKLNRMEEEFRKLRKEIPGTGLPAPEPTWDNENRDIHP